jgi:hypothetical protein
MTTTRLIAANPFVVRQAHLSLAGEAGFGEGGAEAVMAAVQAWSAGREQPTTRAGPRVCTVVA